MNEISSITSKNSNYLKLKIFYNDILYDNLILSSENIVPNLPLSKSKSDTKLIILLKDLACGDYKTKKYLILTLDGILAHYIVRELRISNSYRKNFINRVNKFGNKVVFQLQPAKKEIIDYSWNERTINLAWEKVELDHALSWLSTLGGAFSALGDYFTNCALIAGKISIHQLKLALRLGDESIAARCKLYFSLSLIQRGYLKLARSIIFKEYVHAKNAPVKDTRLIRMCQGIWAKLKYEYKKKKQLKFC